MDVPESLAKLNRETLIDSFRGVQRAMPETSQYADHTVEELQEFLRERKLPVSGTKAELIQRLEDDDAAEGGGATPTPEGADVSGEPVTTYTPAEDPDAIPDGDPAKHRPTRAEVPEDTTCEASGKEIMGGPVPEEQRHPYSCPVCGKNFDFETLDPDNLTHVDVIPEHDDIRLVPEDPTPDDLPQPPPYMVQGRTEDLPVDEQETADT